ncbi:3-phosphoserine/phosphohydroxythreonine transaminase [Suttonella sp. R2A3]|uniref:3-phosphoserine/phosphohydroxythreonine transaminase n=1 Tax=Suttonella sp. R2A3 TaxID=2908648 RepID=UPI001F28E41E|nr:3-phosphoserine/phosphohydroxythreonine transaminase [Suttonella sp. R2A3]UJF24929.1 3-phosphoserine/phosphohydroxythreonine transaminase [Suttonella sp. R2A3]
MRIHNFCAGPCTLPLSVLEAAQAELTNFADTGMSMMEISHRSQAFMQIHEEALQLAQRLSGAPEQFKPLLLPGGASQQFAMSAQNLLGNNDIAAIVKSGIWAKKALQEANRVGRMEVVWDGAINDYTTLPESLELEKPFSYLHLTSNETVNGLQFPVFPEVDVPLVIDASSDYFSRELPWERCAVVYGGVQKNLAPSGLALVFVREDYLEDHPELAKFYCYKTHADANSLYNTPPTWQIYLLNKVLHWMEEKGGITYFADYAQEKSTKLYAAIDGLDFYHNDVDPRYRSTMNVIFRTPSQDLDIAFAREAEAQGLNGLKGHRSVGGLRASLYNALEMRSVDALIDFMNDFATRHV